ncbi:hypothetical protein [Rhizobium leguminosarum]|uniref:hypothetical protein n=1 Tax=Rhizobium leguminosarum TaxID=384 RepID=UPI002E0FEC82
MTDENATQNEETASPGFDPALRAVEADIVVVIENRDCDWPADVDDVIPEKRRHTHPTSPVRQRGRGSPSGGR